MESKVPLVSVVIPTYKRPDKLPRAINSVLNQTIKDIEVIVVDDNNPDTDGRLMTEKIMSEYRSNPRVHYLKHPFNKNGSAARNTGAKASKSRYIAFLDDDDEFLTNKIELQIKCLSNKGEDWAVCYSKYYTKKENSRPVASRENSEGNLYFEALSQKICLAAGSNLLVKRTAFEEVGGFDESFVRNQDHELLTKLLKRFKIAYSSQPGLIVHVHECEKKISYEEVIRKYINSFQSYIDDLSDKDKKAFYQSINKSRFYYFARNEHNYQKCNEMIINREISICDIISLIINRGWTFINGKLI